MIWQVAAFSGVEVLTYCIMSNHFHVLLRVPESQDVSDQELMRRYQVLYPKPTRFQSESVQVLTSQLKADEAEAALLRQKLLARMGDVSEYMKAVKQRFSVWYNRNHRRYGTLWAERFKSVLVEGKGNALQTMAAYIDLNPVRAGLVEDPKDYRFCGYAEAVAGHMLASEGLKVVWADRAGLQGKTACLETSPYLNALQCHRELIFGKRALKVLEKGDAVLPKARVLRCRVRYFTDGAILGSQEYVRGFVDIWQMEKGRKRPPKTHSIRGADWQNLACIQGLRKAVFS